MITYPLAAKLFDGFSVLRWTDFLRQIEFSEIDHHAFKSITTYFLGKTAERCDGKSVDWTKIVNGNIFDLMSKISTSDIKSPVGRQLKNDPVVVKKLNKYIVDRWSESLIDLDNDVKKDITEYLDARLENIQKLNLSVNILRFSHKFASLRELQIIQKVTDDGSIHEVNRILEEIKDELRITANNFPEKTKTQANYLLNYGMNTAGEELQSIEKLLILTERLRYQTRWSQTPRIPTTSVLGHCMYTATLAFFTSRCAGFRNGELVNNFYAALFHDFSETLTRDIISPIKKVIGAEKIAEIEMKEMEEKVFIHAPMEWKDDLKFIMGHLDNSKVTKLESNHNASFNAEIELVEHGEFVNRSIDGQDYKVVAWSCLDDLQYVFANNPQNFVYGEMIKICDSLAAYMEARMSIQIGIRSQHLESGIGNLRELCKKKHIYGKRVTLNADDFFNGIIF